MGVERFRLAGYLWLHSGVEKERDVICRFWRGWTTAQDAPAYEQLLRLTVIPGIEARSMPGFRHVDLMRRAAGDEVEFATIMWFDDLAAVNAFVGEDCEAAHVPAAARALLCRWDDRVAHYEVFDRRQQSPLNEPDC